MATSKTTEAKIPAQPVKTTSDGWEIIAEESATTVLFDAVGDVFTGVYEGTETITPDNGDDPFTRFVFIGASGDEMDGKRVAINISYKLENAMKNANIGDLVRITYAKDIKTKRGLNPMKDFTVAVKRA